VTIFLILDWIFYGLVRYILYLIPLVKAPKVYRRAPLQWWSYNGSWDWSQRNADNGHPNDHWCRSWLEMAFGELQKLATDKARPYVDQVKNWLLDRIGYIRSSFPSLGAWVNWLQRAVGESVPYFAANLAGAASWLYFRLPASVRQGWRDWDAIWEWIKASVRQWAQVRYDAAKGWAWDAVTWVVHAGDQLLRWRDHVAGWIDHVRGDSYGWIVSLLGPGWSWLLGFWANARATVIGWLGPDWPKLVTFSRDCVTFYYNLWSAGWSVLAEFIADPKGFIMDRLEQVIMDRW